jgi:hypothetical protein
MHELPCSEKLVFDTSIQATATATVVAYRYGSKVYPYRCPHCDLWHLSSKGDTP